MTQTLSVPFDAAIPAPATAREERMARIAKLLDREFRLPIIGARFGLDGLIGLIPGVGDAATSVIGSYLILEAAQGGARKRVLAKMATNTLVDLTLGSIPLVDDLFDFAFRSNTRNAKLALDEMQLRRTA